MMRSNIFKTQENYTATKKVFNNAFVFDEEEFRNAFKQTAASNIVKQQETRNSSNITMSQADPRRIVEEEKDSSSLLSSAFDSSLNSHCAEAA
jgi:hypothetical protein